MTTSRLFFLIISKQSGMSSNPSAQSINGFVSMANSMNARFFVLAINNLHGGGHSGFPLFVGQCIGNLAHFCRRFCAGSNLSLGIFHATNMPQDGLLDNVQATSDPKGGEIPPQLNWIERFPPKEGVSSSNLDGCTFPAFSSPSLT
jgi:hypothetical protein